MHGSGSVGHDAHSLGTEAPSLAPPPATNQGGEIMATNCHEMKMGEVYACEDCGLELKVVKECRSCGTPAEDCKCPPAALSAKSPIVCREICVILNGRRMIGWHLPDVR